MRDSGLSASDVALLSGNNGRGNDGMFGDNGAWWVIIFLIFAFGGWGGNGFGGNRGGQSGVASDYVLSSDMATLQRNIESVNQGLCNGFYETLQNFNTTNMNLASGFANLNNAFCNQSFQIERGITGLGSQLAECCCQTQRAIDGVNYNMAMNTNSIQQTLCNNTRDIIESNNANYRALHDEIVANRIEDKNAQITAQQNEINALRLAASQERQNNYLISQLAPKCPEPAYVVQPPQNVTFPTNCCGNVATFSGCNCGNY